MVPAEMCFLEKFEEHTAKALLGDDNTWTVSDYAHEWYNGRSVIETWKELGITTTTDTLEPRPASELDFLSAHTVFMNGRAVPLYDRNKLMQSLLFAPQEHITPETTLTRVCCLLQIGWTDLPFRKYCRALIEFLLERYDRLLMNDQRWIIAKCNIQSDEFYYRLFTGAVLQPQMFHRLYDEEESFCKTFDDNRRTTWIMSMRSYLSDEEELEPHIGLGYQELEERLNKPDIEEIMSSNQTKGKKNSRRRNRRRGARKGSATGMSKGQLIAMMGGQAQGGLGRRRPKRRAGRRGRAGGKGGGRRGPLGIDGVGIGRGGEIINSRTHSAPEIREGEELIATVLGSVGFATTQFSINPANATTFPWLSKIAQLFERFEFEMLSFHFGHDVSGFATQGQTGLVYLSALYDAAAAAPGTVSQIEATDPFVPCMPNQDSCCRLDKKSMHPSNEPKYCLQGNPPGATDIKTYNVGSLFVTTTGMANTSEIGKLRVKYRVRLFDRILDASQTAAPANFSVSWFQSTAAQTYTTTVAATALNATATTNGLTIVNTAGSMVPPAGNYIVDFEGGFKDTSNETLAIIMDFQKNAVSVFATTQGRPQWNETASAANQILFLSGSAFVTANGTDAFTQVATLTGAVGTLTGSTSVRWTAV